MIIAILGGSGFLGDRLAECVVEAGHSVVIGDVLESKRYKDYWTHCDIVDKSSLRQFLDGSDCVVNLAAVHRDDVSPVSLYYQVNVEGQRNILEIMDELEIRNLIFTSSVAVYGMNHQRPPDEKSEATPFNHYGKSKYEAELVIREWIEKGDSRCATVVRPTVIYGEGNRGNVYNLLNQIFSGRFMMVGSGENKKSMAYVGNVAAFIGHMLRGNNEGLEVYNYVDKPDLTMNQLVDTVYGYSGKTKSKLVIPYFVGVLIGYVFDLFSFITRKKLPVSSIRIKKFCSSTVFEAEKICATGFEPPFAAKESLLKTLKYEFDEET